MEMELQTSLSQRLAEEDAFVGKLIDTIPPKIYFNQEINEYLEEGKHKYIDTNVKKYGILGKKLKIKGKHKRARLDPLLHKTVTEIQSELERNVVSSQVKNTPVANPFMLQEKLAEKIENFKSQRKVQKGQHFAVKQRNKDSNEKKKKRTKRRKTFISEVVKNPEKKLTPTKNENPMFNKEAKIVYSKFDFGEDQHHEKEKPFHGKHKLKRALDKLNVEKEKLQKLSSVDSEKAERFSQKMKWKAVLSRTQGIKVKDNPDLLKKSMKRREQMKKKSQKKWADRGEHVKQEMEQRQAKRTKNIRARKQQRINKKIKRAQKKGRFINGS